MARKPEPPKAPPSISESVNDLVDSVRAAAGKAMDNTGRTVTSVGKLSTIPPDTIELIAELPKVMLAMADMIERANNVIDRVERLTAVADPALNTLDAVLPPLVEVTGKLSEVQRGVNKLPGVSHLRKATGLGSD
ncbi:hypothetical protein TPB0596_13070 [Tsukamurella pulmonis]|uniref:Uncharacterized protein n=1 Tax=Tsukamurella pulmonis TaxID=47312 RepID=A0A1H1GWD9_9ACTN|nr:hypothetical protein [Tsukamurella pulmonis]KXO88224.1 hypothetical protein AXK56_12735 [Tsukamurella pulmonis]KXP13195.1 hypothetical protein AXK57_02910 [Tsukamurella pulmonis]RDH10162.1 hypothetical protein DVB88_19230 [Tsukamurella pulmonis]SDR17156.1 hypothetical protein SAMN04489765_3603 [Tsukamurella pulmonis]SUP16517.1 Uncharacterised protein [Tsukamurella pulmonis]